MINRPLEQILRDLLPDGNIKLTDKSELIRSEFSYPISWELSLCSDKPIPYSTLASLKQIVSVYQQQEKTIDQLENNRAMMDEDLLLLMSNQSSMDHDDIHLGSMFGREMDYAILRNKQLLFNRGIKEQQIDICIRKLEARNEFGFQVSHGELFVSTEGDYSGIFQSDETLAETIKQLIRLKLIWLNKQHQERLMLDNLERMQARFMDDASKINNLIQQKVVDTQSLRVAYAKLENDIEKTLEKAVRDSLTNTYNRNKVEELLAYCLSESSTEERNFSIILLDIDHFKLVNDTYGHLAGDKVLVQIAQIIGSQLRDGDVLARWGGEEFLIVLPNSDKITSKHCAERLCDTIYTRTKDQEIPVTASFGTTAYHEGDSTDSLIQRADTALYTAKSDGRNRVVTV